MDGRGPAAMEQAIISNNRTFTDTRLEAPCLG